VDDGTGSANGIRRGVTEPAHLGDERASLMGVLQHQRDLVAWKVGDASDETLRSARTPTGLTLHGIVRHLEDVERWWFRDVFAGEDDLSYASSDEDPDGDFRVPEGVAVADLIARYADECSRSDEVIGSAPSLDAVSARQSFTLRWIIIHLVEETARHLGHMDLLREQADGAVGEEPPPTAA
jgi:hypothetical protein